MIRGCSGNVGETVDWERSVQNGESQSVEPQSDELGMSGDLATDAARRTALAELYRIHQSDLRSFLVALLRDRGEADDALQEVFLHLLESWDRVDPARVKGWLYTVAHRTAMGVHRRRGRDQAAVNRILSQPVWAVERSPRSVEERVEQDDSARVVRDAVARLPEDQRDVVRRRMYGGQTFAAIAAELGCPLGTVLTRMRLALGRLRRAFPHDDERPDEGRVVSTRHEN